MICRIWHGRTSRQDDLKHQRTAWTGHPEDPARPAGEFIHGKC